MNLLINDKHIDMGFLEEDLAFYQEEPYRDWQPRFGVQTEDEHTLWLLDGTKRIALVDKRDYQIDLFEFQPGRTRLSRPSRPAIYHAPSLLGARLPLVQRIASAPRSSDSWELEVEVEADRLILVVTERWDHPHRHSVKRIELRVDVRFGYMLHLTDCIRGAEASLVEIYNLLAVGLTHHHPTKRRFPLLVWRNPDHGLLKWTSNLVSLRCDGHTDGAGNRNLGTRGWQGFFGEADWNPVLALCNASETCRLATCDNLLDEHFIFDKPSSVNADGEFEITAQAVLLSLPGDLAGQLSERARFNDLLPRRSNLRVRPLCLNEMCDFEAPVVLSEYFRGQYWHVAENGEDWAAVSDEKSHCGQWALRLRTRPEDGEKSIMAIGSSMWLDSGRSYRLSAWVCYNGKGPATLRLHASQGFYSFAENRDPQEARLEALAPTGWHHLRLSFEAIENDPCGVIQLHVTGDGSWFIDEMLFEEIS